MSNIHRAYLYGEISKLNIQRHGDWHLSWPAWIRCTGAIACMNFTILE